MSGTDDIRVRATLMVREEGSGSRAAAEEVMGQLGWRPARLMVLGSNAALLAATREGLGTAVIPELAVADDLRSGRLVTVPIPGFPLLREWQAVWPARCPALPQPSSTISSRWGRNWLARRSLSWMLLGAHDRLLAAGVAIYDGWQLYWLPRLSSSREGV